MSHTLPDRLQCRHCRFYHLEGKRGGHCQMLNVFVQGRWEACCLVAPIFVPAQLSQSDQTYSLVNHDSYQFIAPE